MLRTTSLPYIHSSNEAGQLAALASEGAASFAFTSRTRGSWQLLTRPRHKNLRLPLGWLSLRQDARWLSPPMSAAGLVSMRTRIPACSSLGGRACKGAV
eukprot:scaffold2010_cov301-Prasinococcus_capsulatus_cf.AAC.1